MVGMHIGADVTRRVTAPILERAWFDSVLPAYHGRRTRRDCSRDDLADPPKAGSGIVEGPAKRALDRRNPLQSAADGHMG
jgi:hypothetical protein